MTILCAWSQLSFASHHKAVRAGARPAGGSGSDKLALNSTKVIGPPEKLPPWLRREMSRRIFHHLAEGKQGLFVEGPPDELQPKRQALRRQPTRYCNAGQARHVHRHCEDVVEI